MAASKACDGRRQSVRVVEIGALVLRSLGRLGGSAPLSELAHAVAQPPSKTHRYLKALIAAGFVEQDTVSGFYRLGVEALSLGLSALAAIDVVAAAAPHIDALSARVNETVLLSIWANQGATVVHVKEPLRRVTVVTRLGSVLPLLASATGLVFAAHLPAEIAAAAAGRGPAKLPAAELEKRLRDIRAKGVAAVHGLFFPGIDALAAPVFDAAGRIAAVLAVLGPTTSFDASLDGLIARAVRSSAAAVSARIGHAPAADPPVYPRRPAVPRPA